jgi:hypothetical protein
MNANKPATTVKHPSGTTHFQFRPSQDGAVVDMGSHSQETHSPRGERRSAQTYQYSPS